MRYSHRWAAASQSMEFLGAGLPRFTFTFLHLADAINPRQLRLHSGYTLHLLMHSLGIYPMTLALLGPWSTI